MIQAKAVKVAIHIYSEMDRFVLQQKYWLYNILQSLHRLLPSQMLSTIKL